MTFAVLSNSTYNTNIYTFVLLLRLLLHSAALFCSEISPSRFPFRLYVFSTLVLHQTRLQLFIFYYFYISVTILFSTGPTILPSPSSGAPDPRPPASLA